VIKDSVVIKGLVVIKEFAHILGRVPTDGG
jgi:hypothetical protein